MNLAEIIYASPAKDDEIAIFSNSDRITYGELREKTARIAGSLRNSGLKKGDHVSLVFPNFPDFIYSYFAVISLGGVVVPVNPIFKPYEMNYIFSHSDAKVIIYSKLFEATVKEAAPDNALIVDDLILTQWAENGEKISPVSVKKDTLAVIMYTSGTTGKPKGAMLSHGNLMANSESVIDELHLTKEDIMLTVLPLFHSFGAMVGMISPLRAGGKVVLLPRFMPDAVIKAIRDFGVTIFPAVPSMFAVLNRVKDVSRQDLPSLKYCISGGAPMPLEVMEEFERKFGVPIYEGDGPTECSPVTAVNPIGGKRKPASIGLPVKFVEMEIADENGKFLPPEDIGEIVVKGPNVFLGYYKDPEATKEAFFGEWFRTGDIGKKDKDGYFYILDRKKDMIIVDGMNVYPREIEELLYRIEGVSEAAVVGVKNKLHGEIPVAFIALKESAELSPSQIREFLRDKLAAYKIPRKYVFLPTLPKTPTGKISKMELREKAKELIAS